MLIYFCVQCRYKTVAACATHLMVTTDPYINADAQHSSTPPSRCSAAPCFPQIINMRRSSPRLFWDPDSDFELRLWRKGWCLGATVASQPQTERTTPFGPPTGGASNYFPTTTTGTVLSLPHEHQSGTDWQNHRVSYFERLSSPI